MMTSPETLDKILWRHLRDLPYFRAMLRAVEDSFYQDITLPEPVLDVGCGDGHFASVAFERPLTVGIDPWSAPLHEAHLRRAYNLVLLADGTKIPFPDGWFASAVSNSVLEHIPPVEQVLVEVARVVRPGGLFVFCVPNDRFTTTLLGTTLFHQLGLHSLSQAYSRLFNAISRHAHCDGQEVWKSRLNHAGFSIERCWDYFPPQALHTLEVGHLLGLPALVSRKLTGKWILAKNRINLWLPWLFTRKFMDHPLSEVGAYTFYVCRRSG
jgi:SAM-dependent methyltransferase